MCWYQVNALHHKTGLNVSDWPHWSAAQINTEIIPWNDSPQFLLHTIHVVFRNNIFHTVISVSSVFVSNIHKPHFVITQHHWLFHWSSCSWVLNATMLMYPVCHSNGCNWGSPIFQAFRYHWPIKAFKMNIATYQWTHTEKCLRNLAVMPKNEWLVLQSSTTILYLHLLYSWCHQTTLKHVFQQSGFSGG